jgi:hypothetical protein
MSNEIVNEMVNKEHSIFSIKEDYGPFDVLDKVSLGLKKFGLKINLVEEKIKGEIYQYKYEIIPIE